VENPNRKDLEVLANDTAEYYPVKNAYQLAILLGLNRTGKHIYGGTVPAAEKDRRRKANKVARESRRKNRK
jgi:hypothetical protein